MSKFLIGSVFYYKDKMCELIYVDPSESYSTTGKFTHLIGFPVNNSLDLLGIPQGTFDYAEMCARKDASFFNIKIWTDVTPEDLEQIAALQFKKNWHYLWVVKDELVLIENECLENIVYRINQELQ